MYKLINRNKEYWIIETKLPDKITCDVVGIKEEVQHPSLILDSKCFRMIKDIAPEEETIKLIKATIKDAKLYCKMINEIMEDVPHFMFYKNDFTKQLIYGGFNELYFVLYEGRKVGIVEVSFEEDIPEVMNIGFYKQYRHLGLGKKVMNTIMNRLKEYKQVTVVVTDTNSDAYKFYGKLGFQINEHIMNYYLVKKD